MSYLQSLYTLQVSPAHPASRPQNAAASVTAGKQPHRGRGMAGKGGPELGRTCDSQRVPDSVLRARPSASHFRPAWLIAASPTPLGRCNRLRKLKFKVGHEHTANRWLSPDPSTRPPGLEKPVIFLNSTQLTRPWGKGTPTRDRNKRLLEFSIAVLPTTAKCECLNSTLPPPNPRIQWVGNSGSQLGI